ncbi:hypothetical protein [Halobacillus seohaensis]|uniref:Lipoprotein n=1 Tax=Halobacillus seohaensis TaxID=447421 RepID=A0ABW2EFA1_9BACI
MRVIQGTIVLFILAFLAACGGQDEASKEQETKADEKTEEKVEEEPEAKKEEEPIDDELSEEELIAPYTDKLNELKIEPQGISTGEWNISMEDNILVVGADPSEQNLWDIFGVYDSGEMEPLVNWAKEVYVIVDELSNRIDKPWDLSISPACVAPYPKTLPNEDLMNWSGSCGYGIPVLEGTSKEDLTVILNYKVFGDNQEVREAEAQEPETEDVVNLTVTGQWYHPTSPNDYYEFHEDGSFAYKSDVSGFTGGTHTVSGSQVDLSLPDGSSLQGFVDGEAMEVGGLIFSKDQPAAEPVMEEAGTSESIVGTIWADVDDFSVTLDFYEDEFVLFQGMDYIYSSSGQDVLIRSGDVTLEGAIEGEVLYLYNPLDQSTSEYIKVN